jgi:hypothetical protein
VLMGILALLIVLIIVVFAAYAFRKGGPPT